MRKRRDRRSDEGEGEREGGVVVEVEGDVMEGEGRGGEETDADCKGRAESLS